MTIGRLARSFTPKWDVIVAAKDGKELYKGAFKEITAAYGSLRVCSIKFEEYEDYSPKVTIFLDIPTSDWLYPYYPVLMDDIRRGSYSAGDIATLLDLELDTAIAKIEVRSPFTFDEAKTIQRAFYPDKTMEDVFLQKYTVIPTV